MKRLTFVSGLCLWVLGCGSEMEEEKPPADQPAETTQDEPCGGELGVLLAEMVEPAATCSCASEPCHNNTAGYYRENHLPFVVDLINAGVVRFHADRFRACIQRRVADGSCPADLPADVAGMCLEAFEGSRKAGEACRQRFECAPGLACRWDGTKATCGAAVPLGGECSDGTECEAGAACEGVCVDQPTPISPYTRTGVQEGGPCSNSSELDYGECAEGLGCRAADDAVDPTRGHCARVAEGDRCGGDSECGLPLVCRADSRCGPLAELGEECRPSVNQQCVAGLRCITPSSGGISRCGPLGTDGEPCNHRGDCAEGLVCDFGGKCAEARSSGAACRDNNGCHSNICEGGICQLGGECAPASL